jgi:hypothetical protein
MRLRVESGADAVTRIFPRPGNRHAALLAHDHFPATIRAVTPMRMRHLPGRSLPGDAGAHAGAGPASGGHTFGPHPRFHQAAGSAGKDGRAGQDFGRPGARIEQPGGCRAPRRFQPPRSLSNLSRSGRPPGCASALRRTARRRAGLGARARATFATAPAPMDSLERSDCEEAIAACLLRHGVAHAWDLAPALVDAGCEAAWFDRVYAQFPAEAWPDFLARIAASLTIGTLLDQIENSTGRISDLVRAIKEYTYMDQGSRPGSGHPPGSRKHAADAAAPPETRHRP